MADNFDKFIPDWVIGTLTLTSGSKNFTATNAQLLLAPVREGDTIMTPGGLVLPIESINADGNGGVLVQNAPAAAAGTYATRIRFQSDNSRFTGTLAALLAAMSSGNLQSFSKLAGTMDMVPIFTGAGSLGLVNKSDLGVQDPNGNLADLAALVLAANKIFRTDASGNPALGDISNAAAAMLALAGAADRMTYYTGTGAAAVTTLTAFARTLLAGVSAAAMRTTLGLGTASTRDIGTTGSTVPVLNAVNTWQGRQIFQPATSVQSPGMLVQANNPWAGLPPSTGGVISSTTQGGAGTTGMSFSFLAEDKGDVNQGIIAYRGYTVSEKYWAYRSDGSAYALNGAWVNSSDRRLKENIQTIPNALEALAKLNGCTWQRIDSEAFGVGLIAQDANEAVPGSAPVVEAERELPDGTVIEDVLALDTAGVGVAVLVEAAKEMLGMIRTLEAKVSQLEGELRGLSATSN